MNRFIKKVTKMGSSRIIRMTEAKIGQEFVVISMKEYNFLKEEGKDTKIGFDTLLAMFIEENLTSDNKKTLVDFNIMDFVKWIGKKEFLKEEIIGGR